MIGWYGTALGCSLQVTGACRLQLSVNSKWRRRLSVQVISNLAIGFPLFLELEAGFGFG